MCKFQGISDKCGKIIHTGLAEELHRAYVVEHNKLRSKIAQGRIPGQPPAANMRQLLWNTELENIAQRWAEQCKYATKHDANRNKLDNTLVGQCNWGWISITNESAKEVQKIALRAAKDWFNGVKVFKPENIEPYKYQHGTGHYSQVVWADTSEIGCGFAYFHEKDKDFTNYTLVCNYAIGGNVIGGSMYIQGDTCSKCPKGTICNINGLCMKKWL